MRSFFVTAGAALLVGAAAPALAQDAPTGSPLQLSGFGTLGAVDTDGPADWGFRREFTQPLYGEGLRAGADTRLGLQANYAFDSRAEAVAQLVVRDRLEQDLSHSLEWAFVSYKLRPDTTLRVGRVSPSVYMQADVRSIGFAYLPARPSVDFYGALPISSVDGADISHTWEWGGGRWQVRGLVAARGHADLESATSGEVIPVNVHSVFGLALSREQGGLSLTAHLTRTRLTVGTSTGLAQVRQALTGLTQLPVPLVAGEAAGLLDDLRTGPTPLMFVSLGAEYDTGDWLMAAEYGHIYGSQIRVVGGVFAYAYAGRRFGDFTPYLQVGSAQSSSGAVAVPQWQAALTPVIGAAAAAQAQQLGAGVADSANRSTIHQQSVGLGLRWDVHPQVAVKLQWDRFHVGANGSALWARGTTAPARVDVGTALIDFVF